MFLTHLASISKKPAEAAGAGFALFGLGLIANAVSLTTDKYSYADDTVASGTVLSNARSVPAAAGNRVQGVFHGGVISSAVSYVNRYHYSTNTNLNEAAGTARAYGGAFGNDSFGVFGGGQQLSGADNVTTTYCNYSTNTFIDGGNLNQARSRLSGASNATIGKFFGGLQGGASTTGFVDNWSLATLASAGSTSMLTAKWGSATFGDATHAINVGGLPFETLSEKHTYADGTRTTTTALTANRYLHSATSNATHGIIIDGNGGANVTNKYAFATNAMSVGTALGANRDQCAGVSSSPGGF